MFVKGSRKRRFFISNWQPCSVIKSVLRIGRVFAAITVIEYSLRRPGTANLARHCPNVVTRLLILL